MSVFYNGHALMGRTKIETAGAPPVGTPGKSSHRETTCGNWLMEESEWVTI